jgi:hypothetical protein
VVWCLLALAALVAVEIVGLRWFYAARGEGQACHCDQPWRGEYIANFGHPPEAAGCRRDRPESRSLRTTGLPGSPYEIEPDAVTTSSWLMRVGTNSKP